MAGVGALVGWRTHDGAAGTVAGFVVLAAFGYALT